MKKKGPEVGHRILIRFTEEEYTLVKENVARCRLFTQSYFRMLIKGRRPTEKPGDDFFELEHNLHKIMGNLIQMTLKALQLEMKEADIIWKAENAFNNHCTDILRLMLRSDRT